MYLNNTHAKTRRIRRHTLLSDCLPSFVPSLSLQGRPKRRNTGKITGIFAANFVPSDTPTAPLGEHGADGAGVGNDIESEGDDEDSSKESCGVGGGADDVVSMGDENSDGGFYDVGGHADEEEESGEDEEDCNDAGGHLDGEVRKMECIPLRDCLQA